MGKIFFDFGQDFSELFKFFNLAGVRVDPPEIIPRRINFPGVLYPSESIKNAPKHDTPRFDTPASQSPRGTIPRQVNFCSTHSSVAQVAIRSIHSKSRVTVPGNNRSSVCRSTLYQEPSTEQVDLLDYGTLLKRLFLCRSNHKSS